jgi:Tfp pilus assembly protein PilO
VSIGKAVPPTAEVPALIDQLAQASSAKSVDFSSITTSSSAAPASSASSAAASVSVSEEPFTLVFEGSFFDLEHLLQRLTDFATLTPAGDLQVSGRLLTIQSVKLAPGAESSSTSGKTATSNLSGTITATAYVLPAAQGLTATSTASATGAATPASTTATPSSPTAPAVVKVNP